MERTEEYDPPCEPTRGGPSGRLPVLPSISSNQFEREDFRRVGSIAAVRAEARLASHVSSATGDTKARVQRPAQAGCTIPHCPMQVVHQLFALGKCPEPSCSRTVDQLVRRSEQKLVDTMLVADLVHLAHPGESCIAVLSSDDDLWPGMLMAMSHGMQVVHVGTKRVSSQHLYGAPFSTYYTHGML